MASSTDKRSIFIVSAIAVVCVGLIVLVAIKAAKSPSSSTNTAEVSGPASADLMGKVTGVSASTFDTVGLGSITAQPALIDAPALTKNNKPYVLYAGGEFCPYCAAERWSLVVALSRFGSFSNLGVSHSSSADTFPNTPTFTFHGATYTSQYLSFDGVETLSNVSSGTGGYTALDKFDADQQKIVDTYDAPPYVTGSAGSIPFIAFGGKYVSSGATYSPQLLQGKTIDQIAATLNDPNDATGKGIIGAANVITAAICSLTGAQPSAVCSSPTITSIQTTLNAQKKAGVTAQ